MCLPNHPIVYPCEPRYFPKLLGFTR
eukprot:COSAG01_NODE_49127_length_375_cov_0.521739_1_plen_25_part_10